MVCNETFCFLGFGGVFQCNSACLHAIAGISNLNSSIPALVRVQLDYFFDLQLEIRSQEFGNVLMKPWGGSFMEPRRLREVAAAPGSRGEGYIDSFMHSGIHSCMNSSTHSLCHGSMY